MSRRTIGARVYLLATSEGGRSGPLLSGYRSLLRFEGTEVDFGFELELDGETEMIGLAPGGFCNARLSIWAVEELSEPLRGQSFEIREGSRVVGHGSVTEA